jgi:hypothetical protein
MQIANGSAPGAHLPSEEASGVLCVGAFIVDLTTGRSFSFENLVRSDPKNLHLLERPFRNQDGLVV